jgi:hypothetical protein
MTTDDHDDDSVFAAVVSNVRTIANTTYSSRDLISNSVQAFSMEESNELEKAVGVSCR